MTCRLIQYRIAEAAVIDSLLPWVNTHACDVFEGKTPIVVADHAHQLTGLKARVLEAGISAMGMKWQTAAGLRKYLCHALDISFEPLGRENLELILRVAARERQGRLATALAVDPSDALRAMDELGRSGRLSHEWQAVLAPEFSYLGKRLEATNQWLPVLEEACLREAEKKKIELGPAIIFGWGGSHFPDLRLISALQSLTNDLTLVVPQPRLLGGEDIDEQWVRALEAQLGVESEVAQDPADWESAHESFVSSLIMEEPPAYCVVPEVLVGHTTEDQAALVADWVERLNSQENSEGKVFPVGCLVSGEGGSLYQLTREFTRRGILFHQEVGEVLASGGFHTFHKLLVRCFSSNCDIEEILRLFEWLLAREEPCVAGLEYGVVRNKCLRQFNQCQRRCYSDLWVELEASDTDDRHDQALLKFAGWLKPWAETLSWDEARERWSSIATSFGFGADYLEPVWSRLTEQLKDKSIPSRYFFDYLESLLGAPGLWRDEAAVNPYARIMVTTQEAAVGRTWGALVFMDSQEGVWPAPVQENPFLKDAQRKELNEKVTNGQSRLLTGRDRTQIRHQMVLSLMENCRGKVLFSGSLTDGRAPEVKTFPNEWAAQVLLATADDPARSLEKWEQAIQPISNLATELAATGGLACDAIAFGEIHQTRSNPDAAIGSWDFQFALQSNQKDCQLSASKLDGILAKPASFAMEGVFKAVSRDQGDFDRKEAMLLGIWTHANLAKILEDEKGRSIDHVAELFQKVQPLHSGLWMNVLAEKASWMVRACLSELQNLEGEWQVEDVECTTGETTIETTSGPLTLVGRLDLILRSSNGEKLIIDFKTGKSGEIPTSRTLKLKGEGLQYVAYLLQVDAEERKVIVINPFGGNGRSLSVENLQDADEHLAALAHMSHLKTYPRRGELRDNFGFKAESLPLTTLPIDQEDLAVKWQNFLEIGTITGGKS